MNSMSPRTISTIS